MLILENLGLFRPDRGTDSKGVSDDRKEEPSEVRILKELPRLILKVNIPKDLTQRTQRALSGDKSRGCTRKASFGVESMRNGSKIYTKCQAKRLIHSNDLWKNGKSSGVMYTIHHEADTTVFERRHLEGAAHSRAATKDFYFRAGAPGGAGEVRSLSHRPAGGHAGAYRHLEGSGGFA